ncbi:MAG: NAD(P)/FAD-dependent oxidoreductase [Bacilli bacterium]|nr:NAD(P)/FAD-dependent oxidoreductase [Bacilli bacterium]
MYDVIIVGAGPSGVMTAYELIQKRRDLKILLIEQGHSIKKRFCPREKMGKCINCKPVCNITAGFSGAGAFSDGKLNSYHLSNTGVPGDIYLGGNDGGYYRKYYDIESIKDVIKYTDEVYLKFGAEPKLEGTEYQKEISELQDKAVEADLSLVTFPIRHIGTEKTHELFTRIEDYLLEHIEIKFDTEVTDVEIKEGICSGISVVNTYDKTKTEQIYGKHIVLAVGREGAHWLFGVCQNKGINSSSGPIDIGIRYELPDSVMKDVNKYLYEAKFIGRVAPFKDKVRTFCQNPSGFVSTEVYDNKIVLANGHSYKNKKSENTNLAILVSHNFKTPFDRPLDYGRNVAENLNQLGNGKLVVQRLGDLLNGKRTWDHELKNNSVVPTLTDATAGDISFALGYRTMTDIINTIKAIDKVIPGFANPDNLMYGPEIKFYSNVVEINHDFETNVKNLYCIGDGGGLTTGLIMASASGIQMGRIIDSKIKGELC